MIQFHEQNPYRSPNAEYELATELYPPIPTSLIRTALAAIVIMAGFVSAFVCVQENLFLLLLASTSLTGLVAGVLLSPRRGVCVSMIIGILAAIALTFAWAIYRFHQFSIV